MCTVNLLVIIILPAAMIQLVLTADNETDENCALLGHYAASRGNILPTFRDNLLVLTLGV